MSLISETIRISQELDLAVFPVNDEKRPLVKGWPQKATRDPEEIEKLFSMPGAALVGVPAGPGNDIMAFDLDFGHDPTPEERQRLQDWLSEHGAWIEKNARLHQTRSGGLHVVTCYPERHDPPRLMAPKFEVIREGFFFVWPTAGSGYEVLQVPDVMDEPPPAMMKTLGGFEYGNGGSLMSADEADETMRTDGAGGARHDALLRMTQDWASAHPELITVPELCQSFEDWFTDIYGGLVEAERVEQMLEWRVDERSGEVSGELGRAMAGVTRSYDDGLPDAVVEKAVAKMLKSGRVKRDQSGAVHDIRDKFVTVAKMEQEAAARKARGPLFTAFDPEADYTPQPWLIRGLLREKGNWGIIGMSGVGKTTLAATIIAGLISGDTEAVGLPPIDRPIGVAWLNAEEEVGDLYQQVQVALKEHGLTQKAPFIAVGEEVLVKQPEGLSLVVMKERQAVINMGLVDQIAEEVKAHGIDVVMADPITEFNDGNENDRGDAKTLNRAFKLIGQKSDTAIVYWAHTGQPPEGKRPDWYKRDMYAQRGSSQNIGALKTAATHWHMIPAQGTALDAWNYLSRAKDGADTNIPNLTALTVLKIKRHPSYFSTAYELKPSTVDPDTAVAYPVPMKIAEAMVEDAASGTQEFVQIVQAKELVRRMGPGVHGRGSLEKVMKDVDWFPSTLKPDRPTVVKFLMSWTRPVVVKEGEKDWAVKSRKDEVRGWVFEIGEVE